MHSLQALEADKAPELLHYILSAGLLSSPPSAAGGESEAAAAVGDFSQAEARRRLVEALEATVPRDKVRSISPLSHHSFVQVWS